MPITMPAITMPTIKTTKMKIPPLISRKTTVKIPPSDDSRANQRKKTLQRLTSKSRARTQRKMAKFAGVDKKFSFLADASNERSKSRKSLFEAEEILKRVIKQPSLKLCLFIFGVLCISGMGGIQTTFHSLTAYVPYSNWHCLGDQTSNPKCFNAIKPADNTTDPLISKTTICNNSNTLKEGLHFAWNLNREAFFTTEFGLYCGTAGVKDAVVQIFFIGSALGTVVGWILYDIIGRRSTALIGLIIAISATTNSAFAANGYYLFYFRFIQGFSLFIYYTAVYIYIMEISPPKFRVILSTLYMMFWSFGIMLELAIFFILQSWSKLLLVMGLLIFLSIIPMLYGPDSPRFKLVVLRREEEARKEMEFLFNMNGDDFNFEQLKVALTFHEQRMDEITGINTLKLHPKFVREILILSVLWFVVGFSYYGFAYSFSSLSSDINISVLFAGLGEVAANLLTVPPLIFLGRKISMQIFFFVAGCSFLVMMLPFPTSVELLCALIGNMAVSGAFSCIYLYTFELTPTTHRGRIFNYCQFCCRLASFLGAKSSTLYEKNKILSLAIFASMSFVSCVLLIWMPITKDRPTPDVPIEVEKRKRNDSSNSIIRKLRAKESAESSAV